MSQDPNFEQSKPRPRQINAALFMMGLLIFIPSGLCTAVGWLPAAFASPVQGQLEALIIFGIAPMVAGAAMMYRGLGLKRRRPANQDPPSKGAGE